MFRLVTLVAGAWMAVPVLADPVQDVRCREIGFSRAAEARDQDLFASFIDADARFVGANVFRGPAEIVAAWTPFLSHDGPEIRWRPEHVEVLNDAQLALTRGPYRVRTRNEDGEVEENWGTFNSVWRRQSDGSWRVVFDAGSPASEEPGDELQALMDADDDCD